MRCLSVLRMFIYFLRWSYRSCGHLSSFVYNVFDLKYIAPSPQSVRSGTSGQQACAASVADAIWIWRGAECGAICAKSGTTSSTCLRMHEDASMTPDCLGSWHNHSINFIRRPPPWRLPKAVPKMRRFETSKRRIERRTRRCC